MLILHFIFVALNLTIYFFSNYGLKIFIKKWQKNINFKICNTNKVLKEFKNYDLVLICIPYLQALENYRKIIYQVFLIIIIYLKNIRLN